MIAMDDEEDSTTNIYSLSRQVSIRSSPLLKDMTNESLHKAHSLNVNVLTKKIAALSDSFSALRMPSSDHNSTCMDALIQLKNSLKADLIDIRNSINDFEDQVQRQNDKIHSLSEIIHKQEISKKNPIKRSRTSKRKLNAYLNHPLNRPVLHLPQIILNQRLLQYHRITFHPHLAALKTSLHTSLISIKHISKAKSTIQCLTVAPGHQLFISDLKSIQFL